MRIHKSILFGLILCLLLTGLLLPTTSQAYLESFENGIPGSWSASGDGSWTTTTSSAQDGTTSLQSPTITHEQSATLQTIRSCATGDITFYYMTSTEENNDQLQFYIDGELIDSFSGENDWMQASYPVMAGLHTFEWTYSKDLNFTEGQDTVWLDQVQFPVNKVSAGFSSSFYIHTDDTLWAWGKNDNGQLGDGTTTNRLSSVQVGNDSDWDQISTKAEYCLAIKADGSLWGWGHNYYGVLGDGTTIDRYSPMRVGSDSDWAQVVAGFSHSFGIKTDGTLWGWGRNAHGQLGDGTTLDRLTPVQIGTARDWVQIVAGSSHSIALKSDGSIWGWGDNYYGQLGDGTYFQLGDGTTISRNNPMQIGSSLNWTQVEAGVKHTVALAKNGALWAWGWDSPPQIWNGSTMVLNWPIIPEQVGSDSSWSQVSVGWFYSHAIKGDGTLWAWGDYNDGTMTDHFFVPVQVGSDSDWVRTRAGVNHSLALKTDGTLWGWGMNYQGALGDGTTTSSYVPIQIPLPVDTDGDGTQDNDDSFPTDPAASIDTDGDGYPDSWNNGYDQSDSTTGLVLDAYPADSTRWEVSTPLNDTTAFVQQVYQDFLDRDADAGGLAYWVDAIDNQGVPRAQLVEGFLNSAEFGQTVSPVTRLYFAYFNRIPDYGGLMYWIGEYSNGASLAAISDAFAGSAEFTSTYGSLYNSAFVTLVYQNVLGRAPDAGGLAYWISVLDNSEQTRGQVMIGFSESTEYQNLMVNQIYVTMTYIGLLRRSPDQGGFNYWVGVMDSGGSGLALIEGFLTSGEYAARF